MLMTDSEMTLDTSVEAAHGIGASSNGRQLRSYGSLPVSQGRR